MMSEKRFIFYEYDDGTETIEDTEENEYYHFSNELVGLLNEQQELIEELQVSNEMGWKRAEHFEKKCPKELHNKKMYIQRLEYKIQKFKEENEQLKHYKLYEDNKRLQTIIADLKEENKQLRQQQQRLYNYFRDYLEDEMSAENFGEMWDNVKEDERWE